VSVDKREAILARLAEVFGALGVPVERDRYLPITDQTPLPLLVVRDAGEDTAPPVNARQPWSLDRWSLRVAVGYASRAPNEAALRADLAAKRRAVLAALQADALTEGGGLNALLSADSLVSAQYEPAERQDATVGGWTLLLTLTYDL